MWAGIRPRRTFSKRSSDTAPPAGCLLYRDIFRSVESRTVSRVVNVSGRSDGGAVESAAADHQRKRYRPCTANHHNDPTAIHRQGLLDAVESKADFAVGRGVGQLEGVVSSLVTVGIQHFDGHLTVRIARLNLGEHHERE